MENKQARENFQAILTGREPARSLSIAEAKARLRSTDPGLDIGCTLRHLSKGEIQEAGVTLAVEIGTTITNKVSLCERNKPQSNLIRCAKILTTIYFC